MKILKLFRQCSVITNRTGPIASVRVGLLGNAGPKRGFCSSTEDSELKDLMEYMDSLKNYEKSGVPVGAGTDSDDGFDLGRMRTLMELLGRPHFRFKAVHIAGTKGKGSTAAFLCNILRAEGYSVGCYTSPHIRITLGRSGQCSVGKGFEFSFSRE